MAAGRWLSSHPRGAMGCAGLETCRARHYPNRHPVEGWGVTDEPKKKGWFSRLAEGLSRSSKQMAETVVATVAKKPLDQAALDDLEEMLIEADLGPRTAAKIAAAFGVNRFGKTAS